MHPLLPHPIDVHGFHEKYQAHMPQKRMLPWNLQSLIFLLGKNPVFVIKWNFFADFLTLIRLIYAFLSQCGNQVNSLNYHLYRYCTLLISQNISYKLINCLKISQKCLICVEGITQNIIIYEWLPLEIFWSFEASFSSA